ncbi:MAG: YlxR family protein [Solirubrobacteraceae bacterium]
MPSPASEPQRRCVGCGRSAAKPKLLRLVAADGLAVPDPAGRRGGRGAYLCRPAPSSEGSPDVDQACLDRAVRRGGLARALRQPVRIPPDLLASPSKADAVAERNRTSDRNHLESID